MLHLPPSPTHSLHTLTDSHAIKPSTRQAMYTLSMHAHSEIWPAPDLGNFPSEETLTSCAYLYLARFAAWCPILDSPRGSFLIDKAAPILLKAVAAVGSVYGKDALQELGLPLAELIRRDIVFLVSLARCRLIYSANTTPRCRQSWVSSRHTCYNQRLDRLAGRLVWSGRRGSVEPSWCLRRDRCSCSRRSGEKGTKGQSSRITAADVSAGPFL
jgi:hypothetical protein